MEWIKKNFLQLIVLVVVALLLLERCNAPKPDTDKPTITTKTETKWEHHKDTLYIKPTFISGELTPVTFWDTLYLPSPNDSILREQYMNVVNELLKKNYVSQSFPLDSFGSVYILDTVSKNMIQGRSFSYNIKVPVTTNTITIREPYKPKSQLYFGGGIAGNETNLVQQINAGVLFKNKRDQIYGINAGLDITGKVAYGIQSYWKLSFKKK